MEFNGRKISQISHIRDNGSVSLLSPKHKRAEGTGERILFYILFSLPCQSEVTLTNHGCLWAHSHRDGRIILLFCVQELTAKPDLRIYLREFSFTWLDSVTSDWQRREREMPPLLPWQHKQFCSLFWSLGDRAFLLHHVGAHRHVSQNRTTWWWKIFQLEKVNTVLDCKINLEHSWESW